MIKLDETDDTVLSDIAPDLTPMLDILFILLVFFILTAGAVFQSLELTLPENVSEELELAHEPKHIMLEIRPQNYALDGEEFLNGC
jgi:biopolymer transport protein ExbD